MSAISLRAPLLALALLAACAAPPPAFPDPIAAMSPGGLTDAQARDLGSLGVPVLVPADPGTFTLADVATENQQGSVSWAIDYRRADGACFEVSGGNDGFGAPAMPLVSTEVVVGGLRQRVRVYQAADDPGATSAQVWGLGTVVSDLIDLDGAAALFLSDTDGGCRPVTLEEGARIVSSLVLLAPGLSTAPTGAASGSDRSVRGDFSYLGPMVPAEDVLRGRNAASTPKLAADAVARRYSGDAGRVTVDLLSEGTYEAAVLVTLYDLRDDSVRDSRLLLRYEPVGGGWKLSDADRQVRCQPNRGHSDWGPRACA